MADDYDPTCPTLENDENVSKQFLLDKENFMKPEKVKSRWRRNSEMESQESNLVDPANCTLPGEVDNKDVAPKSRISLNFDLIEENLYLFERKKTKRRKEVRRMLCECSVNDEGVGCGEECLNRLLMIECGSRCPTGDACSNRRFQKRQYVKSEPFIAEKKGYGLKVLEDVPRGSFIYEYVGEVLNTSLFKQRVKQYAREKENHYYFMALSSDRIIDARNKGNLSRLMNHSCDPNCETQKWTVHGDLRIGFFARRDIKANEELTFDYKFVRYGRQAQKCFCKSENCSGYIGVTGEREEVISIDTCKKENKNKKLKKSDRNDKGKEDLEEVLLEEEIEKLCANGLRNKDHTLILARLMVRAEDAATRERLLDIILGTTEMACLRLFLDYHGLTILMCWMADVTDNNLKSKILQVLALLPVTNKNMLIDSKVYALVEKWACLNSSEEQGNGASLSFGENAFDKDNVKKLKSCDTSDSDTDGTTQTDNPVSCRTDSNISDCDVIVKNENPVVLLSDEEHSSDNKGSAQSDEESPSDNNKTQSAEINNLANSLLLSWKDLKEEFRIPRRVDKKDDNSVCNGKSDKSGETLIMLSKESSDSPNDEKPQEIQVVCPNFLRKYSHSTSRLSMDEKRSFGAKMQHRRKNMKKNTLYTIRTHNSDYKAMNNDNYHYTNPGRENMHYMYQPPALLSRPGTSPTAPPHLLQTPGASPTGPPCLLPTPGASPAAPPHLLPTPGASPTAPTHLLPTPGIQTAASTHLLPTPGIQTAAPTHLLPTPGTSPNAPAHMCSVPPPATTCNVIYPAHDKNAFKMPPPTFLRLPPPTVAPEHVTTLYANSPSALLPPPSHIMNLGVVNSPLVPMQVNVCAPDPVYMKESVPPSQQHGELLYDKPVFAPAQPFPTSQNPEQTYPFMVQENGESSLSQKCKSVPLKLPPNWKTATDNDGNVYFYHVIKRESRWDPPTPDDADVDNETPTYDEPKTEHKHEKTHSRRTHQKHSKRKSTTTAPADTSSNKVVNNEIAKKIKELFRTKMSTFVIQCLNKYRKGDCKVGRIVSNEDFKHLARKLTHFVMAKELKHCKNVEDLDANESVKFKARDFIHKYMARYGPVYRKDKCDGLDRGED